MLKFTRTLLWAFFVSHENLSAEMQVGSAQNISPYQKTGREGFLIWTFV